MTDWLSCKDVFVNVISQIWIFIELVMFYYLFSLIAASLFNFLLYAHYAYVQFKGNAVLYILCMMKYLCQGIVGCTVLYYVEKNKKN